tara:strand:- start:223 stop:420 length:198 start_codon:yes stop_codon:yes gene_type:complete
MGLRGCGAADLQRAEAAIVRVPVEAVGILLLLGHVLVRGGRGQDAARDATTVLAVDDDSLTWAVR